MSKTKISQYSQTASNNTDINSININEGCPPSTINNAIRELMKQIKDFQVGAQGDGLTVSSFVATTATIGSLSATSFGAITATSANISGAITATSANISGALTTATANITTATITNVVSSNASITGGSIAGITDLAVADGGTGRSTLTEENVLLGDGTNAVKFVAPGTSGNVLTSNGTTWASAAIPSQVIRATAQATTSGSNIDFTGIPSWVKRITVVFSEVSHNASGGTSNMLVQLGDAGGIETTGYVAASMTDSGNTASTAGFIMRDTNGGTSSVSGLMTLVNISGNTWVSSHAVTRDTSACATGGGTKTLSDTLTQIRLTTVSGTPAFDAGSINIIYE